MQNTRHTFYTMSDSALCSVNPRTLGKIARQRLRTEIEARLRKFRWKGEKPDFQLQRALFAVASV